MKTTKSISVILLLIISIVSLNSCKKYPEGPGFSLRTAKGRITNQWVWKTTTYNGQVAQSGSQFGYKPGTDLDIKKDGSYIFTSYSGTWAFTSDKESVNFTISGSSSNETYKILKLTSKELWLYEKSSNNEYVYRYEKK